MTNEEDGMAPDADAVAAALARDIDDLLVGMNLTEAEAAEVQAIRAGIVAMRCIADTAANHDER